jgi:hypothetical protein
LNGLLWKTTGSPSPWLGRQPDVRTPSWIESLTALEVTEAKVLLAEVCLLKERVLTAEVVVADFIFKNIQSLKNRAYPAYLYSGVTDSTRVTNRRIPAKDLVRRLDMILRGKVSNVGAPVAYSAWNLPPPKSFFNFVSNPSAGDSGLGIRVRPSPEDIEVLVASLCDLPNDERQVHFEMPMSPDDVEMNAMLDMLAGESSDSGPTETMAIAAIPDLDKATNAQKPEGTRPKRRRQVSRPAAPAEEKKKKRRRLRRLSCLDQGAGPSAPVAEEVPAEVFIGVYPTDGVPAEVDPNGCDRAPTDPNGCDLAEAEPNGCNPVAAEPNGCDHAPSFVCIFDEDEEEEEVPLIRKNSRLYRGSRGDSDIPSPALSALVSLQDLSITDFDRHELQVFQDEIVRLRQLVSRKDSVIKDLRASKRSVAQELEVARLAAKVAEDNCVVLKTQRDKAMDKAIRTGRILMRRPGVVVPDDIVVDVKAAPYASSRRSSSIAH